MSSQNVFEKYAKPRPSGEMAPPEKADEPDDLGAFGWIRGAHERAVMLELRRKDGTAIALGYAWLERAEFDPSVGITLSFSGKTVKITGRELNRERRPNVRLFAGILRHRVPWIQEADGAQLMEAPKDATLIETIKLA